MNNKDYLNGFKRCKNEIIQLRDENEKLSIEINAINRVLHAVNNHQEPNRNDTCREDIVYLIRQTERDLEEKLKQEK